MATTIGIRIGTPALPVGKLARYDWADANVSPASQRARNFDEFLDVDSQRNPHLRQVDADRRWLFVIGKWWR